MAYNIIYEHTIRHIICFVNPYFPFFADIKRLELNFVANKIQLQAVSAPVCTEPSIRHRPLTLLRIRYRDACHILGLSRYLLFLQRLLTQIIFMHHDAADQQYAAADLPGNPVDIFHI